MQSGWCLRLAGSLSSLVHAAHDASEVCGCHLLKNDSGKLAMAARVRMETTLPIKWIDLPGWPTAGSDQAGHPS